MEPEEIKKALFEYGVYAFNVTRLKRDIALKGSIINTLEEKMLKIEKRINEYELPLATNDTGPLQGGVS